MYVYGYVCVCVCVCVCMCVCECVCACASVNGNMHLLDLQNTIYLCTKLHLPTYIPHFIDSIDISYT